MRSAVAAVLELIAVLVAAEGVLPLLGGGLQGSELPERYV